FFNILCAEPPCATVRKSTYLPPLRHLAQFICGHAQNAGGFLERVIALYHVSFPLSRRRGVYAVCGLFQRGPLRKVHAILRAPYFTNIDCKPPALECKGGCGI